MEFSAGAWYILAGLISLAIAIISFFVKKAVNKTDEHDREISEIKRTYVNKDELKSVREETQESLKQMQKDISEIKMNTLQKNDFYRTMTRTEDKVDKMYDLILSLREEKHNA